VGQTEAMTGHAHAGLPPDRHVHTEWSWDAEHGSMVATCRRAVALGLRSVAFTDHADFTAWALVPGGEGVPAHLPDREIDGAFLPPPLDLDGYRAMVEECRARFPDLEILFGVELSEPHWHPAEADDLLARGGFDLVVGGMHSLAAGPHRRLEVADGFFERSAEQVVRDYLAEVVGMVSSPGRFDTLAHIDYPIRRWPASGGTYRPEDFEEEYRAVLRALAASGRALEVNTRRPLEHQIVRWWWQEGGGAVTFGSDAHDPLKLAHGFAEAAAMVEAVGFRSGVHRHDFWLRHRQ
jgi:histidinol-phosphatase (PHP family)